MRLRMRSGVLVAAVFVAAGCGTSDVVDSERADAIEAPPTSTRTSTTPTPSTLPDDGAERGADNDGDAEGRRAPATGGVDALFPDLGSPDVDVVSYDVQLEVGAPHDPVEGRVEIAARVAPDVSGLALDAVGLEILGVEVDGQPAESTQTDTDVVIDLPVTRGETVTATIDYTFEPGSALSAVGLPVGWFSAADGSYVLNQPDGTRSWLPSNDHPSDKAQWRFEVTAPEGSVVSANGDLRRRGGDGLPWVWVEPDPMPTYLVQLLVGDYEIIEGDALGSGLPITHVVPRGRGSDFDAALMSVEPQLEFFEELFGAYPLSGYGLAVAPTGPGYAMETQGRSLISEADFDDPMAAYGDLILAHEIVHQWFGNAVSPATWDDIWLSESFATYGQWLWLDHIGSTSLEGSADAALAARQEPDSPTGAPTAGSMFGFNSYDGGAAVVHALRLTMGDEPFFELLRRWVAEHQGTSQPSEEFEALAEEIHGEDLTGFFERWLYASTLPAAYPS